MSRGSVIFEIELSYGYRCVVWSYQYLVKEIGYMRLRLPKSSFWNMKCFRQQQMDTIKEIIKNYSEVFVDNMSEFTKVGDL